MLTKIFAESSKLKINIFCNLLSNAIVILAWLKPHCKIWQKQTRIPSLLTTVILLGIGLVCTQGTAALSAVTNKTIQGYGPRFIAAIESDIEAEQNFKYFGVSYNNNAYFSSDSLLAALKANGINIALQTPNEILLDYVLASPLDEEVIDTDGDGLISIESRETVLSWHYRDADDIEYSLSNTDMNTRFGALRAKGIYPYVKIAGPIVLKTSYGDPSEQHYPDNSISITKQPIRDFFIPLVSPEIQYAGVNVEYANGSGFTYPNNTDVFQPKDGYGFVAKTAYLDNFPTTGSNGLYFYLIMKDVPAPMTKWQVITSDKSATPITATVEHKEAPATTGFRIFFPDSMVLVTLQGPTASNFEDGATAASPNLPVDIELIGRHPAGDNVSYKFRINQWFVQRGRQTANAFAGQKQQMQWCENLSSTKAYTLASKDDLSNAQPPSFPHARRNIKEGLIAEWGQIVRYGGTPFYLGSSVDESRLWTTTPVAGTSDRYYTIDIHRGDLFTTDNSETSYYGICTSKRVS